MKLDENGMLTEIPKDIANGLKYGDGRMEESDMRITKEEAIEILSTRDSHGMITGYAGGIKEAIDMGLEALKRIEYDADGNPYILTIGNGTSLPKGRCKDCRWWKDSDGAYRRGIGAESHCPINHEEVYAGNGYCFMFEPQESEEE